MITNLKALAKTPLREKALRIVNAGYEGIEIERVVKNRVQLKGAALSIVFFESGKKKVIKTDISKFKKVMLVGFGKGSALTCISIAKILGTYLTQGIALDTQKPKLKIENLKLEILTGTHPLPSEKNVKATHKILDLVKHLGKNDLLIVVTCGGGSALATATYEELKDSSRATKELSRAGADIVELNTVRKHLSVFKGGGLARFAYPAKVLSLIVSDVLGNDLSMVASGPLVLDRTTKKDAEQIIKKYLRGSASRSALIRVLMETPKEKAFFKNIIHILFVKNEDAVRAMQSEARKFGFRVSVASLALRGEAKNILVAVLRKLKKGEAIIAGGESTVTLRNKKSKIKNKKSGKGGRNMEAVLGAVAQIPNPKSQAPNDIVVVSFASDGRDNTEAAGAIGDFLTLEKAKKLKLDPKAFLSVHNTFHFFKQTKDLIYAEKNNFNVSDLMVILKSDTNYK